MIKIAHTGIQAVEYMLEEYLVHRSVDATLAWLTEDIQWVGTGANEEAYCKRELREILLLDVQAMPAPFKVESISHREIQTSDRSAHVLAKIKVADTANSMAIMEMRVSYCCRKEGLGYLICAVHASVANALQQENEFFPVYFAENKLRELEGKYARANDEIVRMYNCLPGAVFRCRFDADWTIIFANDGLFRFIGYTRDEFEKQLENKMAPIIYPADKAVMTEKITRQLEHGTTIKNENRLICKDGTVKWVAIHGELIAGEYNEPCFYCVAVDITEQKDAQKRLANSEKKLRDVVNNIPGGIVELKMVDGKLVPTYMSAGWCAMMGDTRENLMQLYREDGMVGVYPDDRKEVKLQLETAMKNGTPINSTYRLRNASGKYRWVNNRGSFARDEEGTITYSAVYTDVNAEMQAEEKQKRTEEKLMAAMEHATVMYWEYEMDKDLCINGFKSIHDLGMPELMPNYPECLIESGFIHPDSAQEYRLAHQKLKAGVPAVELNIKVSGAKGDVEWKKVKYTVIYDQAGTPTSALGTSEDITQQKRAEERYRQAEHYRQVLDTNAVGSFKLNLTQNTCADGHGKNDRILKYQEAKTVDGFFEYIFSHYVESADEQELKAKFSRDGLLKAFEHGKSSVSCEHRYMMETGEVVWFRSTAEIMKNPENDDIEAIIYAIDISEHKNAEMLIRGVVATEFDFITQLNANTGNYSMYIQNKEKINFPSLTGRDFYEKNAEFINEYVVDEEREKCLEESKIEVMVARLERDGDYYTYYQTKNPDGTIGQKKLHIFYSDKEYKTICIARTDITKDLEQQKRKNDMLKETVSLAERANRAKTAFLSRMSHDIRTPMNAIIGMTELTKQEIGDTDKVMQNLSVIDSSSKHLMRIINDILDMSQIESGNLTLMKESFDCAVECKNVEEMAQVMFHEKKQQFTVEKQLTHRRFFGDIVRIKRILTNLLNNASKFTPEGGQIWLRIMEEGSANPSVSMLTFEVTDSGCGIPQNAMDVIFQPFYQVNAGRGGGAGLGLSIVKSIVEAKGGTIGVKSTEGQGATFTIVLPMELVPENDEVVPQSEDVSDEMMDLSGLNILLVEDHPINTLVAKRLMEKRGAAVDTAENGAVGYDMFLASSEHQYSLIFMDVQMPVMNGYEAAKAIRSSGHPQARTIPIIAMTANAYAEDVKKSLDSGMNAHLAKPISMTAIAKIIRNMMEPRESKVMEMCSSGD